MSDCLQLSPYLGGSFGGLRQASPIGVIKRALTQLFYATRWCYQSNQHLSPSMARPDLRVSSVMESAIFKIRLSCGCLSDEHHHHQK